MAEILSGHFRVGFTPAKHMSPTLNVDVTNILSEELE
jgi:hypothetical protein